MNQGNRGRFGWGRLARLGVALGTLVAGVVVFVSGAAKVGADALRATGVSPDFAFVVAGAGAAVLPLVVVGAVLVTVEADRRFWRIALGGGLLAVGGIGVAAVSPAPFTNPAVVGLYGLGSVLLLVALVGGVLAVSQSRSGLDRPTVEYTRTGPTDGALPSDGGEEEDDDLEFPLDDEE